MQQESQLRNTSRFNTSNSAQHVKRRGGEGLVPRRLYGSRFSNTHRLPETSVRGSARRFAAIDISELWLDGVAIRLGFSKLVTRNGSPTPFPRAGSKRIPQTLKQPSREEIG